MEVVLNNTLQRKLECFQKANDDLWSACVERQEVFDQVQAENDALLQQKSSLERQIKSQEADISWLEKEICDLRGSIQNKDNVRIVAELDLENVKRLQNPQSVLILQNEIMEDRNIDPKWRERASSDELIKQTCGDQYGMSDELETREKYGQEQEKVDAQLKQENEYLKEKLAILQTIYNTTETYEVAKSESHPFSVGDGKYQSLLDEVGRLIDFDEDSIIISEYNPTVTIRPGSVVDITPSLIKSATGAEDIRGISPKQETTINTASTGMKSLLSACHVAPPTSRPMKEGLETIQAQLKEQKSLDIWYFEEHGELEQQKKLCED